MDISLMSRDEKLLRRLLGESIEIEDPQSRIEFLLKEIIDAGGIGGGSYKIRDQYDTLAELEAAHPTSDAGDAYLVGNPTHIYIWLTDTQSYADGGLFTSVPGLDGVGITSIEKTSTSGLVDTYTITYTDGETETFNVTNGKDGEDGATIYSIDKTATVGLVDTYTITLTDGRTYEFQVTNGSGGSGVPEGGTTGQVLAKKSDADGDVQWVNQSGGSDVSSEIESLSAAASELASENTVQTSEIGSLASELESMSVSDISSELASLSTEASEHDSEIGSLSTENSTAASELDAHSQSLSEIASAASSTSSSQSEVDSTQNSSLGSLSTENSTQTSQIGSLSTAESEMASELDVIGSELDEKQAELVEGPGIDIDSATNEIKTEMVLFTGTMQEWEALSVSDKKKYTHAAIKLDGKSGIIDQMPTQNSPNPVSSGGTYSQLVLKQPITDNSLQTTNKTVPGAINELNSVANQADYDEYTSQETDTFGYLLCGLLHNADTSKITARSYVTINDYTIFHYQGKHADFFCFSCNLTDKLGNIISVMIGAHIDPTDWGVYRQFTISSSGVVSMDDFSATAIGANYNIKLYY